MISSKPTISILSASLMVIETSNVLFHIFLNVEEVLAYTRMTVLRGDYVVHSFFK